MYIHRPHMRITRVPAKMLTQLGDWRYLVTTLGDGTSYSSPSYDDSSWAIGAAPFGNLTKNPGVGTFAQSTSPYMSPTIATVIPFDRRLWIRRNFYTPILPLTGYHFTGFIDNNMSLWVNGTLAFNDTNANAHPLNLNLSKSLFHAGNNVIVARCDDDASTGSGDAVYFDFLLDPY